MSWENPIKTVKLCFPETGRIRNRYDRAEDQEAVDRLATFVLECNAFIVGLENFSDAEIESLKAAKGPDGRSLFASPQCFMPEANGGGRCARTCPLRSKSEKVA